MSTRSIAAAVLPAPLVRRYPAMGRDHGNRRAPIDSCRNLREYLAAYPGLTALRLVAAAARSGLRAGGYAAVKANRAHRLQPAESGHTLRHTPRPADTSMNTSSAVCASTQCGLRVNTIWRWTAVQGVAVA
jgi:hypothetical protein